MLIDNFYEDFRRSHLDILSRFIVSPDLGHDNIPHDKKSFEERYFIVMKEISINLENFLKVYNNKSKEELNKLTDIYSEMVGESLDKMFHLFFEAGIQSGIILSLDLGFLGKSKITPELENDIINDKSIISKFLHKNL